MRRAACAATRHLPPPGKSCEAAHAIQQQQKQQHKGHVYSSNHTLSMDRVNMPSCVPGAAHPSQFSPTKGPAATQPPHHQPLQATLCAQALAQALEHLQKRNSALQAQNVGLQQQLEGCRAEHAAVEAAVVARDVVLATRAEEVCERDVLVTS